VRDIRCGVPFYPIALTSFPRAYKLIDSCTVSTASRHWSPPTRIDGLEPEIGTAASINKHDDLLGGDYDPALKKRKSS
jgi:hypothetical protein